MSDMAQMEADFNRLSASLVSRSEDEIRETLTRFWEDNLDQVGEEVSDWIEDDSAGLANGEVVTLYVRRIGS